MDIAVRDPHRGAFLSRVRKRRHTWHRRVREARVFESSPTVPIRVRRAPQRDFEVPSGAARTISRAPNRSTARARFSCRGRRRHHWRERSTRRAPPADSAALSVGDVSCDPVDDDPDAARSGMSTCIGCGIPSERLHVSTLIHTCGSTTRSCPRVRGPVDSGRGRVRLAVHAYASVTSAALRRSHGLVSTQSLNARAGTPV